MKLNKKTISNLLTIRYDPSIKPETKLSTYKDFETKFSDPNGKITQNFLESSIKNLIPINEKTITISLSGGIDSTLCLALIRKLFPEKKIVSLCGVFGDGFDESKIAKNIANDFDSNFKIVSMSSIFTNMPEIISITNKPRWNTYTHLIAKNAKKYSKTLVTGDGADELFGGYIFRYSKFLNISKSNDNWKNKVANYLECHNRDWVPDQEKIFHKNLKFNWNEIYKYLKPYFSNPLDPVLQVMLADFNGKLIHDFIPTAKSVCNHYGINTAPIFLNQNLISFALKLPLSQKYDKKNEHGKLILRKLTKKLSVKHMDEKKGFSPSLHFDWKKNGRDICKSYLLDKNAVIFKKRLINKSWVSHALKIVDNDGDIRYLNRLISILALEIWLKIFVTNELKKSSKL